MSAILHKNHGKNAPTNYGATSNGGEGGGSNNVEDDNVVHIDPNGWKFIKYKFREPFAEFIGTFTLVAFGIGSIAQTVLSKGDNAVTITLAVYRKFPWLKVPVYILAQTSGAFVAAAVIYINYHPAITNYDGGERSVTGVNATAGIFATYPAQFMGTFGSFFSEALGTFFLLLVILAVTDERNELNIKPVAPIIIGLALATIALSLGYETGFSLNGARDFGPRLFTFLVGYGIEVFSTSCFYFWIPIVAPVVGGLIAGLVYDSMIYWGKSPLN
nr:13344_t:CDS:2 [Entrophospora candida]